MYPGFWMIEKEMEALEQSLTARYVVEELIKGAGWYMYMAVSSALPRAVAPSGVCMHKHSSGARVRAAVYST
jgi:hypothetical protein